MIEYDKFNKVRNVNRPTSDGGLNIGRVTRSNKISGLARIDTTLKERAGSSITLNKFEFVGLAKDVAEGEAIPIEMLNATSTSETVKKVGMGFKLSDESLLSGYGDIEGETKEQLKKSIAGKVDNDCMEALEGIKAGMTVDKSTDEINAKAVSDALVKFGEAINEPMVLIVSPLQHATLRTSTDFTKASDLGDNVLMTGVVGSVYGCQVVVSEKIKAKTDKFTSFIVREGALAIYMKREVDIETARDIEHKATIVTADQHYVVGLENEAKAIKLITKATPTA